MRTKQWTSVIVLVTALATGATAGAAADGQSKLATIASKTMDALKEMVSKGKEKLDSITAGKQDEVDKSMSDLQEVVLAASERARRLSEWDVNKVEKEAEQTFDVTIQAIQDYLDLVADDGPVHKAGMRIRTAALEKARTFREKANSKSSDRYLELAKEMDAQAVRVTQVWESISKERQTAVSSLKQLKEAKELYVDVKVAKGIQAAVKELEKVRDDLAKLSQAMAKLQKAVIGESVATNKT